MALKIKETALQVVLQTNQASCTQSKHNESVSNSKEQSQAKTKVPGLPGTCSTGLCKAATVTDLHWRPQNIMARPQTRTHTHTNTPGAPT